MYSIWTIKRPIKIKAVVDELSKVEHAKYTYVHNCVFKKERKTILCFLESNSIFKQGFLTPSLRIHAHVLFIILFLLVFRFYFKYDLWYWFFKSLLSVSHLGPWRSKFDSFGSYTFFSLIFFSTVSVFFSFLLSSPPYPYPTFSLLSCI